MQVSQKLKNKKKLLNRIFSLLKWCLPIAVLFFLYYTLEDSFSSDYFLKLLSVLKTKYLLFVVLFTMAFINWGLEAQKWRVLIREIAYISFFRSYKAILLGLGVSLTIPRSIGEVLGRLWSLKIKGREAVIGALLISRGFQLSTTLLGGLASIVYFFSIGNATPMITNVALVAICVFIGLIILILLALRFSKKENKFTSYIKTLRSYSLDLLFYVWSLAFLRFCIYATQYYLVLNTLTSETGVVLFAGILLVYLVKSVIPSIHALGDELMRQSSAVIVFSLIGIPQEAVIVSSVFIWLLNLLLPSIIGVFLIPSAKIVLDK